METTSREDSTVRPGREDVDVIERTHPELAKRAREGEISAAAQLWRLAIAHAMLRSCDFLESDPENPGSFRQKALAGE